MSDTSVPTPEIPDAPVVAAPSQATPDSASTAVSGASADTGTDTVSTDPTAAPETGSSTPENSGSTESATESTTADEPSDVAPVVVNDGNGQHVDMPDGTTVTTRHHTYPVSNSEWEQYEKTHSGDQARYPYVPGDHEYSPYSDPHIPNTHMARLIESEIASYGERVLQDSEAAISPIWNAVKGIYEGLVEKLIETGGSSGKVVE